MEKDSVLLTLHPPPITLHLLLERLPAVARRRSRSRTATVTATATATASPLPAADPPRYWSRTRLAIAVGLLLAIHGTLAVRSLVRENPTVDEVVHLPAGISYWERGTFRPAAGLHETEPKDFFDESGCNQGRCGLGRPALRWQCQHAHRRLQ